MDKVALVFDESVVTDDLSPLLACADYVIVVTVDGEDGPAKVTRLTPDRIVTELVTRHLVCLDSSSCASFLGLWQSLRSKRPWLCQRDLGCTRYHSTPFRN